MKKHFDLDSLRLDADGRVEGHSPDVRILTDSEVKQVSGGEITYSKNMSFWCDGDSPPNSAGCTNAFGCDSESNSLQCVNSLSCENGSNYKSCTNVFDCDASRNSACTNNDGDCGP